MRRIIPETGLFHIICRGNNKMTIFHCDDDYKIYLKLLKKYKDRYSVRLFHFVFMINHIHLVVEMTIPDSLSKFMHGVNLSYVQHYRKKYSGVGHFWQDRFKSMLIENDRYLLACGRYIELNPVRAHIVAFPEDYKWSSYRAYAYGETIDILDISPAYLTFGSTPKERQQNYRTFSDVKIEPYLRGHFIGSREFIMANEQKFNVTNFPSKRGRPFKQATQAAQCQRTFESAMQ